MKKNEAIFLIMLIVGVLMLLSMFLILSVPVSAKEETTTESIFTSEEQEAIEHANHLTDQEHEDILNASQKFLDNIDPEMLATSTDAYDNNFYLSSDQMVFEQNESLVVIFDAIYRMLISIRNILLLFFFGVICAWFHKMFSRIIQRLAGRSKL